MSSKKEVIYIDKKILANTAVIFEEIIKEDCTIEGLKIKFYIGQEKALQVYPKVFHGRADVEDLVTFNVDGEQYLSGDDDSFDFPIVIPCKVNDVIQIKAVNTDLVFDYHLTMALHMDYYGGQNRVIMGVV